MKRPMPEDFAQYAEAMSVTELRAHYRVGQDIITRWHKENGGNPRSQRLPVPSDFRERAPKMTGCALEKHYGVGERMIKRWLREANTHTSRQYDRSSSLRPPPADFIEVAATMSQRALSGHYQVSRGLIARWIHVTGATPPRRAPAAPKARRPVVYRHHAFDRVKVQHDDLRKFTVHDEAADILRRERFIVYRCDDRGLYAEKGDHWRVGNALLAPDELLVRADKYRQRAA